MFQSIRSDLQEETQDQRTQQTYLNSISDTYRTLADILIDQGRLAEAQQVLSLLKQEEFYDYIHTQGDPSQQANLEWEAPLVNVNFTAREAHWQETYDDAYDILVKKLYKELDAPASVTSSEQSVLSQMSYWPLSADEMKVANTTIDEAMNHLDNMETQMVKDFQKPAARDDALPGTEQALDLQEALTPGTAVLDTIVSPDTLDLLLIPAGGKPVWYQTKHLYRDGHLAPYSSNALYRQVAALRQALTDPRADPRPQAGDLYRVLIAPLKADLQAAHVHTLLFSLDDALRYVPPAALYDPDAGRYLVQDYATAVITLAAAPAAASAPAARPVSVLAAGVVQGYAASDPATGQTLDFPDLPGVGRELSEIVRQGDETGGLFSGMRLEDGQFTKSAFEDGLKPRTYSVVHLASHFALHATAQDSYLLLGGGALLPVSELEADPDRFQGVDLLALSACDTDVEVADAKPGTAGREVEGFGALAQRLGARSVLASLWPVSDAVTPELMGAFYGCLKSHPSWALPDVVRWAQLSLLYGHAPGPGDGFVVGGATRESVQSLDCDEAPPALRRRGVAADDASPDPSAPAFTPPANAPYAHPFYWAPFVLIGNWR